MLVICKACAYFTPDILARDISAWIFHIHGLFCTLTFWTHGHSGKWTFHHCGCFGMGTFWHVDFSGQGLFALFGMGTFWHGDISSLGYAGLDISTKWMLWRRNSFQNITLYGAKNYMCRNVHLLKYPCHEMSQSCNIPVRNIHGAEISVSRNVPVPKLQP